MAFANNGKYLITVDQQPTSKVAVWDISAAGDAVLMAQEDTGFDGDYADVEIHVKPEDPYQFTVATSTQLFVWSLEVCGDVYNLSSLEASLAAIHRRSSLTRRSSVAEILDLDKFLFAGSKVEITCHVWASNGDEIILGTKEGAIMTYEPATDACVVTKKLNEGSVSFMALTADGNELVVTGQDGQARWLDATRDLDDIVEVPTKYTSSMAVGPSGKIAVGCQGSAAILGKESQKVIVSSFTGTLAGIGVVGAGESQSAVAVSKTGDGFVWDSTGGQLRSKLQLNLNVTCIATSNVNSLLLACGDNGRVVAVDVGADAPRTISSTILHSGAITHAMIHPAGTYFATVGGGKLVLSRVTRTSSDSMFAIVGYADVEGDVIDVSVDAAGADDGLKVVVAVERGAAGAELIVATFTDNPAKPLSERSAVSTVAVEFACTSVSLANGRIFVQQSLGDVYVVDHDDRASVNAVSATAVAGHVFSSFSRKAVTGGGKMIATIGTDGILMVRLAVDGECCEQPVAAIGHEMINPADDGSVPCFVAASADGQTFLTTDGNSISAWGWNASQRESAEEATDFQESAISFVASPAATAAGAAITGAVMLDESAEDYDSNVDPLIDTMMAKEQASISAKGKDTGDNLTRQVEAIRLKVQRLIEANEAKPDLEKLEREEFQLDLAEKQRVVEDGEAQLAELEKDMQYQILAQQFLRYKIKKQCWDSMEVKGKAVYTFSGKLEVSNYPLRIRSKEELSELRQVQFSRKIEVEHSKVRQGKLRERRASKVSEGDDDDDDELEQEEESTEFYNYLNLYSSVKKRAQIVLLKDYIFRTKQTFNTTHSENCDDKKSEAKKILEKNKQIMRVVNELELGGVPTSVELFVPQEHLLESPEQLLEVKDEEVKVERVLNAEELVLKAEEDVKEAERQRLAAMDNPRERGLVDMMDGSLEGGKADELWQDLPPPSFISEVSTDQWTDAQRYKEQEYKLQLAEQQEMRGKRIKALNTELTNLKTTVDMSKSGFDERITSLFNDKISTEQQVYQTELKILLLMRSLQNENNALNVEANITNQIQKCKMLRPKLAAKLETADAVMADFMADFSKVEKANKALDKAFKAKMLRDFPDIEEHVNHLFGLFKKRPPRKSRKLESAVLLMAQPLDKETECPDGVPDEAWDRLVALREQKLQSDRELAIVQAELNSMQDYRERRKGEDTRVSRQIETLLENLTSNREARFIDAVNVEVLVPIKQGLVEVHHDNDFEPEYQAAVLIPRKLVEELNAQVLQLGNVKLDHMKERMQFRKRSHMLEWEHKKLKMMREDLIQKTHDIQMLRVTRNISLGGGASQEDKNRRENDVLEKTIKRLKESMEKKVATRKRVVAEISRDIKSYSSQNRSLGPQVQSLNVTVDEHATVHRVFLANKGPNQAQERLKAAARRRRMLDVVKVQDSEIGALKEEVDRMRRKTFPAFIPGHRAAF